MPDPAQPIERKLAAIFAADVAGYSRLMGEDEVGTLRRLAAHREIMDRLIAEHRGRIANTAGDSVLAEFPSVVDAVQCAVQVQNSLAEANEGVPENRRMSFRIGVHVGDVMVRGADLLGDGVNIAARLQGLASPGGVCLSSEAHQYARKVLSLVYEDMGHQSVHNIEETIRAYRIASPRIENKDFAERVPRHLPLPDKPSIAVLPFVNMSSDPSQDHIADGVVEEIIAALSRVRSFFVISRNSTFTYKGKSVDPRQVSRDVGVRYVVEGSVRASGSRLRIIVQLIDATTGNHLWGQRYEGEISSIFDLQDTVTEAVVGAIEPSITISEIERAKRKRPDSLDAYDCVMRGLPAIWSQDPENIEGGLRLAERAIELDPGYALPKAVAAWCYAQRLTYFRTKNFAQDQAKAISLAQQAMQLDNNDPLVLTCAAAAYSLAREFALALALIEKALALDPNSSWAWHRSGYIHAFLQQPDVAIQHFERALRLSPLDPLTFNVFMGLGVAHFHKDQFAEAAAWIEKALREKPEAYWANRLLSASYFYEGRLQDAERALSVLRARLPEVSVSYLVESAPGSDTFRLKLRDAFRALGVPE